MLNKIKIGPKLIGGFLIIALIGGIIGIVGITNLRTANERDTYMFEKATKPLGIIVNIVDDFLKLRLMAANALIDSSPDNVANQLKTFNEIFGDMAKLEEQFKPMISGNTEAMAVFDLYQKAKVDYNGLAQDVFALLKQGKNKEAVTLRNSKAAGEITGAFYGAIEKLKNGNITTAQNVADNNTTQATLATMILLIVTVIGVLIALILGFALSLSITKPIGLVSEAVIYISKGDVQLKAMNRDEINKIKERKDELGIIGNALHELVVYIQEKEQIAKTMAQGDLIVEPKIASESDDFGKAYANMVSALNELLGQVNASVEQVSGGAGQVSAASQQLSQGAAEQASSLEEITSSVTEIGSQTKQNTDNAIMMNGLAKESRDKAEQGNTQMKELVSAMAEINKSADEIKKIVKAIDDIAFQINLLALNANVEAARAGKYGKGFAVVAEEVRNLAVRSANSVKETNQMVEDTIKNIANGNHLVEVTAKQLAEIVDGSAKVADIAAEVATASKEQTQGLDQISTGLGQIDQVTQENTASAEESASASEELASQAQQLKAMVARFKLKENTATKREEVSNELIQKIKNEIAREQNLKVEHLQLQHNKPETQKQQAAEKKIVNPKEVIKLDDDNFGKF